MKSIGTPFFSAWLHLLGPMSSGLQPTVQSVRALTLTGLEERLRPYLPPDLLVPPPKGRDRIFPFDRTFFCWIWQMLQFNTSCREVVRQVQALFALHGGPHVHEPTGAYCQARSRLPKTRLQRALAASAAKAAERAPQLPLLQGRPIKAVDGTGLRAPDTPKNQPRYPQPSNQKPGCGFPVLRLVTLFCVTSGAILAHCTGSLLHPELSLFYSLFSQLSKGDIVIGDRGFGHFVSVALLATLGVDFIARVPTRCRKVDFRRAQRLGPGDALFAWTKGYHLAQWLPARVWQSLPKTLTVRLVRTPVRIKGFRIREITLVTTLGNAELYPKEEILAAYLRRWQLELCWRDLKATLGLRDLKCLTPDMVEKELLVGLLTHNLLRCIMAEVAQTHGVDLARISFKGSLDALRQFSAAMAQTRSLKKRRQLWQVLLQTLAQDLVPLRPGRREPRAVKRRLKYPRLNKHRRLYVDRWSRNKRRRVSRAKRNHGLN
jgi:Transposase DDE domain